MESALPVPKNDTAEDSSGSGEGHVRRKYQRTANNVDGLRKSSASSTASSTRAPVENKSSFRGRRQSVREHKGPLGPRPLDHVHPNKRIASDAGAVPNISNPVRSFLPTSTSEPAFANATRGSNPRFSFGKTADVTKDFTDSSGSYDFLPSVNFDDFHASISAIEPTLSDFPAPGGGGGILANTLVDPRTKMASSNPTIQATEPRPTRTSSLIRRLSNARKPASFATTPAPSTDSSAMPPPATTLSVRSRRQSQFPASAPPNPVARPPRKSVGPGLLTSSEVRDTRQDGPKPANDNPRNQLGRTPSFSKGTRRPALSTNLSATDVPRVGNAARNVKAKSFQVPVRQQTGNLSTLSLTPESHGLSVGQGRSPARTSAQRTQTPSSNSAKRQSTMPHVSGLGARTISPTDARRLKRLSMNPNPPGGPISPPTPQAEFSFDRSFNQSPGLIFRKSVTPSSARATPEQNRKSYGSGISISSNSSLNSLRPTNSNLQPRHSVLSGSRLPTPKPRNIHSAAGAEEEEVPPVPAIPKAFESPKDPEQGGFSFSMSSLKHAMPNTRTSQSPSLTGEISSGDLRNIEHGADVSADQRKLRGSIRHRRGLTVGSGSDADKTPPSQKSNTKHLQPLRLPPLNLLPLGTPFNSRISAFPAPSAEVDDRHATPPPKLPRNKTPSTPMTASKALFSKSHNDDQYSSSKQLRSSSSTYNLRPTDSTTQGSMPMPIPTLNPSGRQITTPFASASLPKNSGDLAHYLRRPSGEYKFSDTEVDNIPPKVNGPRVLTKRDPKKDNSSAQTDTSTEPETPSSGSSIRRKLSLGGWRRSSSKASHAAQASQSNVLAQKTDDHGPRPPKHNDMPPPRLPASATWSGSLGASPTPSNRTRPSLDFSRRKPSTTTIASDTEVDKSRNHRHTDSASTRSLQSLTDSTAQLPKSASTSILTPMQRMLGGKGSSQVLKPRNSESNIDRDELAADDEMKKLGAKRKDFEHAARDLDELKKRARPQERVSAAQALQMVNLNIFERGEIIDYKEIYFCGTKNAKKHVGDLNAQTANFGYDDERGDYNIVLGDHLAYRYEVVDVLGKGSFGQVVRCVDHKTGQLVAVKIIRNKKRFHQQALVEVNILQKLREWDPENKHSMINFTQSFYFRGHLCISTELLGMNLYEFIKAHEFKGFSLRLIRRFCKQMLSCLVLLKSHRVIHCDLKPENILLAHPLRSEIKVIDFGSSCFENEKVYTYIQSRFYRSPEVILGMSYGLPIDMWSLGCILAELLTGYPIFPGENEQEQLACIMEIFGPPEKHLIEKSSRKKLFFDSLGKPRVTVSTKGRRRRPSSKSLQQALKCDDEAFLDFITRCLRWDPDRRMKPDEAMLHEFVTGVRKSGRSKVQTNGNTAISSPAKRYNPVQTPQQRVRPLPEPPATSFKNGAAVTSNREAAAGSPVKNVPRRHSTVHGTQGGGGVKRAVNGAPLNGTSSLPRVAQRSVSGKPDLASAAAVASLKTR